MSISCPCSPPLGCLPETKCNKIPVLAMREEVATWGFEAGSGDPPSVQHKVLKWTDYPIAQRILGPAPEIGTLRTATPKSDGETFSPSS